jgi:hypothetical protein
MPSTKTSDTSTFDLAAAFKKVTEGFDAESLRANYLDGVKQSQQFALDGLKSVVEIVEKTLPDFSVPFSTELEAAVRSGIEFSASLFAVQTEFANELLEAVLPKS